MADLATFRIVFPEFATSATDEVITYWMGQAPFVVDPPQPDYVGPVWFGYNMGDRLGKSLDLAVYLFAAHNIVLGLLNAAAAAKGVVVGAVIAPLSSKGAGGLSAGYDTNIARLEGAGIYNGTSYGQRLWKMLEIAAMGGLYRAPLPRRTVWGPGNARGLY